MGNIGVGFLTPSLEMQVEGLDKFKVDSREH